MANDPPPTLTLFREPLDLPPFRFNPEEQERLTEALGRRDDRALRDLEGLVRSYNRTFHTEVPNTRAGRRRLRQQIEAADLLLSISLPPETEGPLLELRDRLQCAERFLESLSRRRGPKGDPRSVTLKRVVPIILAAHKYPVKGRRSVLAEVLDVLTQAARRESGRSFRQIKSK